MASGETKISLRDDQDFNIWFVKEIEKVSCLYNYTDPCYTNRQKQDEAWQKIASDAHVGVTDCKERWKNLRACFTRHLKHKFLEAKSGIRYKKPYYLAEHMNFILPYTKLRSQSQEDLKYYEEIVKQQHLNQPSKQQIQQQQPQTQQRLLQEHRQQIDNNIIYLDATENSNDDEDSPEYDFEPEIDADMMYAENSMYSSNDDQLTTNRDISPSNHETTYGEDSKSGIVNFKRKRPYETDEDPDVLFLKSLLPDMQAMNESQKRKFKIGILKLSDDILTSSS